MFRQLESSQKVTWESKQANSSVITIGRGRFAYQKEVPCRSVVVVNEFGWSAGIRAEGDGLWMYLLSKPLSDFFVAHYCAQVLLRGVENPRIVNGWLATVHDIAHTWSGHSLDVLNRLSSDFRMSRADLVAMLDGLVNVVPAGKELCTVWRDTPMSMRRVLIPNILSLRTYNLLSDGNQLMEYLEEEIEDDVFYVAENPWVDAMVHHPRVLYAPIDGMAC